MHEHPPSDDAVTDIAWQCLEKRPHADRPNTNYYADDLGKRLTEHDPERGFRLLETVLRSRVPHDVWNPLELHGHKPFWAALRSIDRGRALTIVLDAAVRSDHGSWLFSWHLPELIELPEDADFLAEYATHGEAEAEAVCDAITGGREGFWLVAFRIIEAYPQSKDLRIKLSSRVEQMGQTIWGQYSAHLQRCLDDVERARDAASAFPNSRAWLDDLARSFREAIDKQRRLEEDEQIDW